MQPGHQSDGIKPIQFSSGWPHIVEDDLSRQAMQATRVVLTSDNLWTAPVTTGVFTGSAPDMKNKHSDVKLQ